MEKLLRSTKAKKVLVLIRPKKGLETKVRLVELLSAKIFDNLRENSPAALSRVEAISGDITQQHFGLSRDDERLVSWSRSQVIWVGGGYEKPDDLSRYPKNEDILKNEDDLKYRDNLKNDEKTLK